MRVPHVLQPGTGSVSMGRQRPSYLCIFTFYTNHLEFPIKLRRCLISDMTGLTNT